MARWKKTVQLRDLITDDQDAPAIIALADGILDRFPDAPDDIRELALEAKETAPQDDDAALEIVNGALDDLYDWADAQRIWIA